MTQQTVVAADASTTPSDPAARHRPRSWRPAAIAAAGLVLAWSLPVLAQVLHVDWLLPVLILVATAAVLRSGRTVLDRLVIAGILDAGLLCVAGLGFSVWPWHLAPVAVTGTVLSLLVCVAALPGRRPRPPLLWRGADLVTIGITGWVAAMMWWPVRHPSSHSLLDTVVNGGTDRARHFDAVDTIRSVGGYMFLHPAAAHATMPAHLTGYPQGWHFLVALLENFVVSSTRTGTALDDLNRYLAYDYATYVLMIGAVVWALVHVAGRAITGWLALPLGTLVGGYLFFGDMFSVFLAGFVPEIAGLTLLALVVAVLARPLEHLAEQLATVAALTVLLAFTYYFFLPVAAVALLAWAVQYRRRLLSAWPAVLVVAVLVAVLAVVPLLVDHQADGQNLLLGSFGVTPLNAGSLLALIALLVAGLAAGRRWRAPAARTAAVATAGAGLMAIGIGVYQVGKLGHTVYFFDKTLHGVAILALVSLGTVAPVLRRAGRAIAGRRRDRRRRVAIATAIASLAMAALPPLAFGAYRRNLARYPESSGIPAGVSAGALFLHGQVRMPRITSTILAELHAVPDPHGKSTLVVRSSSSTDEIRESVPSISLWIAILQRDYGRTIGDVSWLYKKHTIDEYIQHISTSTNQFQVITNNPRLLAALDQLRDTHPQLGLEVYDARSIGVS